ncbi:MAG: C4-dicarboxylate TRAP transporter substrate-binding protein [Hydrogenophaga sp.]|jgi:TRAP-type transport system periplasmic protein|uniref:C4-dicarboxylate TRAP transporter substrate-binding protein n=1 Tax=Hydrogenophaga intermedia TaxID=65786 RepID=UPI002044A50E|nr:C4-dicarboxylate TRAP transporter substrate-binding protein [Hydrogenophaga intermedia]MCM3563822.1 C4-dicarboxylate TRAP transporter substrate-binding protein [Hydrogenophaga intermedia]
MKRSTFVRLSAIALAASAAMALPLAASAQQVINLTVASSHPTTIPWVGFIKDVFMPEVDKRLAAGGKYKIQWREAFGGQLYKANATLTSVEQGITDIGWVFSYLEPAKMPLSQVSAHTPFTTSDTRIVLGAMTEMIEKNPAFRAEWDKYNLVFLGATGSDTYDLWTKFPVKSIDDLKGKKISAPGILALWLRGVGATPVDGALTTYYTDIQTGVSEGTLSLATGILPAKVYEVAPYVTKVNIGVVFSGGVAINKDSWAKLPPEVQQAMREAGAEYTRRHGEDLVQRHQTAMNRMVELGKTQNPPVTVTPMSDADRRKWIDNLPNLSAEWVKNNEARGVQAKPLLTQYMAAVKARGAKPERDWEK